MMDRLLDDDTSEIADDARATIPRLRRFWCGTARSFDLTIDDSDEDASDEDDGIAALIHGGVQVSLRRRCRCRGATLGHVKHTRGLGEIERELAVSASRIRYTCALSFLYQVNLNGTWLGGHELAHEIRSVDVSCGRPMQLCSESKKCFP